MKKLLLIAGALIVFNVSFAQTWSSDVASIIYTKCSNCHNQNGIAPFSILNYADAVDNGIDMKESVQIREMPPWPPDPAYSRLAHERILSQSEIDLISNWVDNGMPRGDSTQEPATPSFNSAYEITNPDLFLSAPVYTVNTQSGDLYRCFVLPTNLSTDQYLTALEAMPGNRSVVHHILIFSDTSSTPLTLDANDPGPGYTNFGGTGSASSKLIGAWVPGQGAFYAPNGMGIRLPAHTNIILQIHYPGGFVNTIDSTKIQFRLTPNFQREIAIEAVLNHYQLDNGPLFIPANTIKTFTAHYQVPYDVSTLGIGPHMHLIGTSVKSYGVTLSGDTIPFVDIHKWDFHWQGIYMFPHILKIPAGTTIYSSATYDNTSANTENPNNPPHNVHLGEATTDEMMLIYFAYTPYFPGDENIIIDSTLLNTGIEPVSSSVIKGLQLYDPVPNPAVSDISFQYYIPQAGEVSLSIVDVQGKVVKAENTFYNTSGLVSKTFSLDGIAKGIYWINLQSGEMRKSKKLIVN